MDNTNKKIIKLKNGIRAIIIPMNTSLTSVTVSILLGENHEKPNEMELSHYIEHLMGRFTSKKYNDYKLINQELNRRGAITNASVEDYETKFYIEGFYKDAEFYIDLLSNTISNFKLEKSIIKQEKNAVVQELRNYIADYNYIFDMKIWNYMYSKYAYQYDLEKHIKKINTYTEKQVYDFIKSHILFHNTVVSITCPNDAVEKTTAMVKKYFSFPNHNKSATIKYPLYQHDNLGLKVIHIKNNYDKSNTTVKYIVDKQIKYLSKEHLSMMILQEILFNFETGIFYKTLRDNLGLIYNISMELSVDIVNPLSSSYFIQTSTNCEKLPRLIKAMIEIISNLKLTEKEIQYGKQKIIVKYEYNKFNNLTSFNTYYGQYLLHKIPIVERHQVKEKLLKVRNSDIIKTLEKMKNELLNCGLIFYYSKYNMNTKIKNLLNDAEIKYIAL